MSGLSPALVRLLQLASPTLPVGAFAYSDGLETAVGLGWVTDEQGARAWIGGRLREQIAATDLPVLSRLIRSCVGCDRPALDRWARWLRATRDSAEGRAADRQIGQALARLLDDLGVRAAAPWVAAEHASFALGFAIAAHAWGIDEEDALTGYAWSWLESQIGAAVKLVPLGQTSGQRILSELAIEIPAVVIGARSLSDAELGATAPAAAMAAAWHERERVRLFRS